MSHRLYERLEGEACGHPDHRNQDDRDPHDDRHDGSDVDGKYWHMVPVVAEVR